MRKLLAALVVIGGLALANFSTPAYATPTNTVFDRTVNGCDYQFEYGNAFGTPYAEVRVYGADPAGTQCEMGWVSVSSVSGNNSDVSDLVAPSNGCNGAGAWCDNNVWHQATGPTAWSAWAMDAYIITIHGGCHDRWQIEASIYDKVAEGKWVSHTSSGC